ncbi:hypothetical protein BASA50_003214 [Batrachochytrium salamandrivorans]|uniref:Rap-GAP domain-containing protein n=1 Tax=Batrachochytrium salamandrivorans TaxID=1357716 RepID=A0ABQ8FM85_9FUNG|nr:hypothetical protein BASA50_003214 [Batrachochytrium salamandrivorans]KAH6601832.1 hypothetical protein BASA61_001725 [Batrachochytrium salamandrivorans]
MTGTLERLKTTFSRKGSQSNAHGSGAGSNIGSNIGSGTGGDAELQSLTPRLSSGGSGIPSVAAVGDKIPYMTTEAALQANPYMALASIMERLSDAGLQPAQSETVTEEDAILRLQVQTAALAQLSEYIRTSDVTPMLSEIWCNIFSCMSKPKLLDPAFQVMVAILETHFDACDLLRLSFFNAVAGIDPLLPASSLCDMPVRLSILCALTKDGRDLRHIEHDLGPLLLDSIRTIVRSIPCHATLQLPNAVHPHSQLDTIDGLDNVLLFISKVIKFSSIHLHSRVLAELLTEIALLIQNPVTEVPTKENCLTCLDALVRYGSVPVESMHPMVKSLCFTARHPDLGEQAWSIFNNVQRSHHSGMATAELFGTMQLDATSPSFIHDGDSGGWITVVLGSLALFQRLFGATGLVDSTLPSVIDTLFPDSFILSHLAFPLRHHLPILSNHTLESCLAFRDVQHARFSVLEWEILVDIYAASAYIWCPGDWRDLSLPEDHPTIIECRQRHRQLDELLYEAYASKMSFLAQATYIRTLIYLSNDISQERCLFLLDEIPTTIQYQLGIVEYAVLITSLMDRLYFPVQCPLLLSVTVWPQIRQKVFSLFVGLHESWPIPEEENAYTPQHMEALVGRVLEKFGTDTMSEMEQLVTEWMIDLCVDADSNELDQLLDVLIRRVANMTGPRSLRISKLFREKQTSTGFLVDPLDTTFTPAGLDVANSIHSMQSIISIFNLVVQNTNYRLSETTPTLVFRWILRLSTWTQAVHESPRFIACHFLGSLRADDHYCISYMLPIKTDDLEINSGRVHAPRLFASQSAIISLSDEIASSAQRPTLASSAITTSTLPGSVASSILTSAPVTTPAPVPRETEVSGITNLTYILRPNVLPIGEYMDVLMTILKSETQYIILQEVLDNLALQLQNHLLWRDAHAQIQHLRVLLCDLIITEHVVSAVLSLPQDIRKSDIYLSFLKLLVLLFGFRFLFTKSQQDELVSVFQQTLNRWPTNARFCIHALNLALFEMPMSMIKHLPSILMKLSQTTSQALSIPNLEFLSSLARIPELYTNFTEADYRRVFGVSIQYIRLSNSSSGHADAAIPNYITELAFHVMSLWFMSLRLSERRKFVPFIIHNLVASSSLSSSTASPGFSGTSMQGSTGGSVSLQLNEHVELVLEMMAHNTYVDCWPKPNEVAWSRVVTTSSLGNKQASRTWIQGNALLSVVVAKESGWTELIVRRPSGIVSLWIHLDNAIQKINSFGQADWLAKTLSLSPLISLPQAERSLHKKPSTGRLEFTHTRSASAGSTKDLLLSVGALEQGNMGPQPGGLTVVPGNKPEQINRGVPLHRLRRAKSISIPRGAMGPTGGISNSYLDLPPTMETTPSATSSSGLMREEHQPIEPGFIPMLFFPYPSTQGTQSPLRPLPNTDAITRAIAVLDRTPVIELHKIGIIYVAPGQSTESEILSNVYGSRVYAYFLHLLGRLFRLARCRDVYTGGLDTSPDALDGEYGLCSADDQRLAQVIYHVITLMPNRDYDPACTGKKRHIGNDFVSIVWNEGGVYKQDTIPGQFNFFSVVIEPLSLSFADSTVAPGAASSNEALFRSPISNDPIPNRRHRHTSSGSGDLGRVHSPPPSYFSPPIASSDQDLSGDVVDGTPLEQQKATTDLGGEVLPNKPDTDAQSGIRIYYTSLFRVSVIVRSDLPDPGQIAEVPKIVTGLSLAAYVRQLAVHYNMFSQIYAQKNHPSGYASNSRERLRQVKRIRERLDSSSSSVSKGDVPSSTIPTLQDNLDFTKIMQ